MKWQWHVPKIIRTGVKKINQAEQETEVEAEAEADVYKRK